MGITYDKVNYHRKKNIKKSHIKNSALIENIQKNSVDYSKENKMNIINRPLKKTKKLEKKEEISKGEEDSINNINTDNITKKINTSSMQIIDDNIKSLFLNSTKFNKENINININSINIEEEKDEDCEYFLQRAEKIRYSYIQKLVSKEYYLPKNNSRKNIYNSLIIFDWDDTLFPTSFLAKIGYFSENIFLVEKEQEIIIKKLEQIEKKIIELINISLTKGEVYIITNAVFGWVEYTSKKFYPNFYKMLDKIKIISARRECENTFPNEVQEWKMQTFLNLRKNFDNNLVTNIICLGDSMLEIEAGRFLANHFQEAFIKTVKFKENPKLDEVYKQLILVIKQFNLIHSSIKSLIVRVEKRKKDEN